VFIFVFNLLSDVRATPFALTVPFAFISPTTSKLYAGVDVPIPTPVAKDESVTSLEIPFTLFVSMFVEVENESVFDFVSSAFVDRITSPFSFTVRSLGDVGTVIFRI